jgi:hypothetical protein
MPTLTLAPSFFKNELHNYSNWKFAFWRELFQNAIDAKATAVGIDFWSADGEVSVRFSDNGNGMNRETLEDVFFALGNSTKSSAGADTIGGFGKARILICFAQERYQIRTQDVFVTGSGSEYHIEASDGFFEGAEFLICVKDQYGWIERELRDELDRFLRMCQIKAQVTVDGFPWSAPQVRRGRQARRFDWGTVYVAKSGRDVRPYEMFVRVKGVTMFSRSVGAKAQVVVEIDPDLSRDVLMSNRDSLKSSMRSDLDRFCDEMAADSLSATRATSRTVETAEGSARRYVPKSQRDRPESKIAEQLTSEPIDFGPSLTPVGARSARLEDWEFLESAPSTPSSLHPLQSGAVCVKESLNPRMRRASKAFDLGAPWGKSVVRLMAQWQIAVEAALEALCALGGHEFVDYRLGWVLSDDCLAAHQSSGGAHSILINPIDRDGTRRFDARSPESMARILSHACHEVTHVVERYHDQEYANLLTNIVAEVMAHAPAIMREMRRA